MAKEIKPDFSQFQNSFDMDSMAIGVRHIHHATPKHEAMVRAMIQEIERKAA